MEPFNTIMFFSVLVVTGASQGIGKEYAFQVSHHQNGTLCGSIILVLY